MADMDLDEVLAYCLAKPGAEETYPWGDGEMVAKVGGKGFAFVGLGDPGSVGVKATPGGRCLLARPAPRGDHRLGLHRPLRLELGEAGRHCAARRPGRADRRLVPADRGEAAEVEAAGRVGRVIES